MDEISILKKKLKLNLKKIREKKFSKKLFNLYGFCIVKSPFSEKEKKELIKSWDNKKKNKRKINKFNPAEYLDDLPDTIISLTENKKILNILKKIYGNDIGLFRARVMIKDNLSKNPIKLHDDFSYQIGFQNKVSVFLALSKVNKRNGGLQLFCGTHKFGYLGDAGHINSKLLDSDWPVFNVNINPGDFVVMNSSLWHRSGHNLSKSDRVLTDFIYQPAKDYSTKKIVSGKVKIVKNFMNTDSDSNIISPYVRTIKLSKSFFLDSRSIKLQKFNEKINDLKKK